MKLFFGAAISRSMFLALLFFLAGVVYANPETMMIDGLPGPEDIAVDSFGDTPRLFVSSTDRREGIKAGEIFEVPAETGAARPLPRAGEPDGLIFNPHGIDIMQDDRGDIFLYAIIHWREDGGDKHAVVRYQVSSDLLIFDQIYTDPLLVSPNDLSVLSDGTMYVSNDASGRGGMFETVLGLKRSTVVFFDGSKWSVAADGIAMANGIAVFPDVVYLSATRENRVYVFKREQSGGLTDKQVLARIKGPDNISVFGNSLIVAGHRKSLALARHLGASKHPPSSPTTIYQIDTGTNEMGILFTDNGDLISAGSVGVISGGCLCIGQIMDPFVLCVPVE